MINPRGEVFLPEQTHEHEEDVYAPNVEPFNNLATKFGVALSDLSEQIRITATSSIFSSQHKN